MTWAFIWMMFVLKIPIIALLWLVWYAVHAEPLPEEEEQRDDGGSHHPRPRHPSPPRRGPHAGRPPASPARVRARGHTLKRTHG